jgi:hypothetical protein
VNEQHFTQLLNPAISEFNPDLNFILLVFNYLHVGKSVAGSQKSTGMKFLNNQPKLKN